MKIQHCMPRFSRNEKSSAPSSALCSRSWNSSNGGDRQGFSVVLLREIATDFGSASDVEAILGSPASTTRATCAAAKHDLMKARIRDSARLRPCGRDGQARHEVAGKVSRDRQLIGGIGYWVTSGAWSSLRVCRRGEGLWVSTHDIRPFGPGFGPQEHAPMQSADRVFGCAQSGLCSRQQQTKSWTTGLVSLAGDHATQTWLGLTPVTGR
jgi:hypothetical protein